MSLFRVSKREFNFKWCIEESLLNVETCLDSPIFLADSLMKTEWSLQLSIINVSHLRSLVCALKRSDQDDGPNLIGVCFGISLDNIPEATSHGTFVKNARRELVLVQDVGTLTSDYLTKGPLWTVCCNMRMWMEGPMVTAGECRARTKITTTKLSKCWKFLWLGENNPTTKWLIDENVNLNLKSTHENLFPVSLKVKVVVNNNELIITMINASGRMVFLHAEASIKDNKDNLACSTDNVFIFGMEGEECELSFNLSKNAFTKEMQDLFILCELFFPNEIESSEIEKYSYKLISEKSIAYVHKNSQLKCSSSETSGLFHCKNVTTQTEKFLSGQSFGIQTSQSAHCKSIGIKTTNTGFEENTAMQTSNNHTSIRNETCQHVVKTEETDPDLPSTEMTEDITNALRHSVLDICSPTSIAVVSAYLALCAAFIFTQYLTTSELSDAVQQSKPQQYSYHQSICFRSSIFSEMFQINIIEKGCKTEKIRHLSSEVWDVLLLYLVAENLEELEWERVSKLLHAVYKYPIVYLIKHCNSFLSTHLSATNVCDVLVLAETYKNTELKMIAQEFISSHASEIFSSDTWTKFMIQNPKLAAEILHYFSSVQE
ncbi:uncharacterized protein CDAR_299441 [Caerostris darwini]|uniref:BTB domain-containing protein n=1 Tax=Caerostris darwini TaxID=1538125 RepID=A0AAV4RQE8_9ARAC|nr:uncharacterized protein CDAR_299441 [Caerostris darwini]